MRLRTQLKDSGTGAIQAGQEAALLELQHSNKLLSAQNTALRSALQGARGPQSVLPDPETIAAIAQRATTAHAVAPAQREINPAVEEQKDNAARWEVEKKLQRKLGTVEKRLKEKVEELETVHGLLKQTKDALMRIQAEKDALQKRLITFQAEQQQVKCLYLGQIYNLLSVDSQSVV